MNVDETALTWARLRAAGPLRVPAGTVPTAGTTRLVEPGVPLVWLVPNVPDTADARILRDLGLQPAAVHHPNVTARILAACLRCCWTNPLEPPWPGVPATYAAVLAVYGEITSGRDDAMQHSAAIAALRRLDGAGWLLWDDAGRVARLGPRVALWSSADLSVLRELWRSMPAPTHPRGCGTTPEPEPEPDPAPDSAPDSAPGSEPGLEPGSEPDSEPDFGADT